MKPDFGRGKLLEEDALQWKEVGGGHIVNLKGLGTIPVIRVENVKQSR